MSDPPLDAGAVNVTVAVVDPVDVADTAVGEPGTFAGVTDTDEEAVPDPALLTALIRMV